MVFKDVLRQRAVKSISTKVLDKFGYTNIIVRPIMTEKTLKLQESLNKYSFIVNADCNKNDVKVAVKMLYNVEPLDVDIVVVPYKWRTQRKVVRREMKKAIITLKKWDKIEIVK